LFYITPLTTLFVGSNAVGHAGILIRETHESSEMERLHMAHDTKPLSIRVLCDPMPPEKAPRCFYIGARKVEILDVVDRWLETEHGYFKVFGDDGGTYIIKNNVLSGDWELTLYDSGQYQ
jgi:hypothetical protein